MKPEEIEAISRFVDIRQYWGDLSDEQLYNILNTYHKWILGLIDHIDSQATEIAIIRKREEHNTKQDAIRADQQAAEIKRLRTLRTDILQALGRPKTASDEGLLLYVQEEVNYNQKQAARIQELETQVATLREIAVEERARALWFVGSDPTKPPNLDWEISPNKISEKVKNLWRTPAHSQLQAEHPEVFQ